MIRLVFTIHLHRTPIFEHFAEVAFSGLVMLSGVYVFVCIDMYVWRNSFPLYGRRHFFASVLMSNAVVGLEATSQCYSFTGVVNLRTAYPYRIRWSVIISKGLMTSFFLNINYSHQFPLIMIIFGSIVNPSN